MMSDNALNVIQAAERQVDEFLSRYGSGLLAPGEPLPDLAAIMLALERARPVLEQLAPDAERDSALITAIGQYAEKLKELESVLEKLRPQLESRRNEIRARLAKVQAALNWARSFSQTR